MKDCLSVCVLIRAITKVTSVFRSMGNSSVNRVENCGQKHTINDTDAQA